MSLVINDNEAASHGEHVLQESSLFTYQPIRAFSLYTYLLIHPGARCSSVVRAFAHGAMGRRIDPSLSGPIELFLIPASARPWYVLFCL